MSATTAEHGEAPAGAECLVCMEELSAGLYVEFRTAPLLDSAGPTIGDIAPKWIPALMCADCIQQLMDVGYQTYTNLFTTTDCKATLRRISLDFLPYYVKEPTALPTPEGHAVVELWHASTGAVTSAALPGAPYGTEARAAAFKALLDERAVKFGVADDDMAAAGGEQAEAAGDEPAHKKHGLH